MASPVNNNFKPSIEDSFSTIEESAEKKFKPITLPRVELRERFAAMKQEYTTNLAGANITQESLDAKYEDLKQFRKDNKKQLATDPLHIIPPSLPEKIIINPEPNRCTIL